MNEDATTGDSATTGAGAATGDGAAAGGLEVDADLVAMMGEVLTRFTGPAVEPDAAAVWNTLSEVGLARLTAPEESGGSGAGWAEASTLLRLSAAAGVAVPYAETDLVAGPLRRAAGLDDSAAGTSTLAVLGADGRARRVAWAGATESLLCVRRSSVTGDATPRYEVADCPTGRAEITAARGISAVPSGDVTPPQDSAWTSVDAAAVESMVLRGALARAVQCVGAAEGMLDAAIAHTTERTQFGRVLATFQSVQNLVVDIAAETVLSRAAVDQAVADAVATDLLGPLSAFRVAVARSVASQAVALAVRNTHQVHGAIGTTHEHTLHRLTLPALHWRGEFGSAAFWEAQLTETALAGGMDGAWPMVVEGATVDGAAAAWLEQITGGSPLRS